MSDLGFTLDVNEYANDVLPKGTYKARIFGAEFKESKTSNLKYLSVTFKIEANGALLSEAFCIYHPGDVKTFAMQKLARLCKACGLSALRNTEDLLNYIVNVKLDIDKNAEYGDQNIVKGYSEYIQEASRPTNFTNQPVGGTEDCPW